MSDTARLCELLQAQAQLLRVRIAAEAGIKEYDADWLPEAKKVMRDATGKFAKKGATVDVPQQPVPQQQGMQMPQLQVPQVSIPQPQQVQNVTQNVNQEAQELKQEIVNKLLAIREQTQNPGQVKENVKKAVEQKVEEVKTNIAEKKLEVSSELVELASKGLDKLVETNPEFTDKLLDLMFGVDAQEARDRLADAWEELHPELPNAIKPDPYKELAEDLMNLRGGDPKELGKDLLRAFNKVGYDYNKMLDDLNNMPDKPPFVQAMGKAAAMSIPIGIFLGATLAPELAIGMILGDNLGIVLTNAVVAQFWSMLANKAMDERDIKNPLTRLGVDMLIGTASTSGALDIRGIYRLGFHRSAHLAKEMSKDLADSVPDVLPEGTKQVIFVSDNVADTNGSWGRRYTNKLNGASYREQDHLFAKEVEGNYFVPALRSKDFNVDGKLFGDNGYLLPVIKLGFFNVFKKGYNPDALKTSALVMAYKIKHPDIDIGFLGTCGGGFVTKEANEILKTAGVISKQNLTAGTANFGIINSKEYKNFIASDEKWYIKLFHSQKNYDVDFVPGHDEYYKNDFFNYIMLRTMNGHDIQSDIASGKNYVGLKDFAKESIEEIEKSVTDVISGNDFLDLAKKIISLEDDLNKSSSGNTEAMIFYLNKELNKDFQDISFKCISGLEYDKTLFSKARRLLNRDEDDIDSAITNTLKLQFVNETKKISSLVEKVNQMPETTTKNGFINELNKLNDALNIYIGYL